MQPSAGHIRLRNTLASGALTAKAIPPHASCSSAGTHVSACSLARCISSRHQHACCLQGPGFATCVWVMQDCEKKHLGLHRWETKTSHRLRLEGILFNFLSTPSGPYDFLQNLCKPIRTGDVFAHKKSHRNVCVLTSGLSMEIERTAFLFFLREIFCETESLCVVNSLTLF